MRMNGMAIACTLMMALASLAVQAQTTAPAKTAAPSDREKGHRNEDIARHRTIAKAHEEAARCLEAGTAEKQCQQKLRDTCKGIAVGQYCGMRHAH